MTSLLLMVLGFFFAYAIYIATVCARFGAGAEDFVDAGLQIPSWAFIFAGTGVVLSALGLRDHIELIARYGLQYNHVVVGLILVSLCAALVQKRIWLASRITGLRTIGDLMGEYFGSTTIRIYLLAVLFLFSIPFAACCLSEIGELVRMATGITSSGVIWVTAFFLFLYSVIGGWRGVVYVVATQAFLILALIVFTAGFAGVTFDNLAFISGGIVTHAGILPDQIPGVIQFTHGIGKEMPAGGVWTAVAILSFAIAMIGVVLSPGFSFLGISTHTKKAFAFNQVWMTGGLAAGALLLVGPFVGAEMAGPLSSTGGADTVAAFISRLGSIDKLVAIAFLLLLVASLQIGVAFFAASGASIVTLELVRRFILPGLTATGQRLSVRVALALIYLLVAMTAGFTPLGASVFSSLTLSLSAQMLPAFLGLCWLPWISRSGVLTGLLLGLILVVFTEPFGLVAFEGFFVDLPWGRWPLTIHSAGWGLIFNVGSCLLVSLFTRSGDERVHRQRLHDEFHDYSRAELGSRVAVGGKWSVIVIWAFLALGPGAILGNSFFSRPIFAGGVVTLGIPSLFVWQIVFWFFGVLILWWFAYYGGMSVIEVAPHRKLTLKPLTNKLQQHGTPPWISRLLGRLVER